MLRETAEGLIREPKPTAAEAEAHTRRLLELADKEALSKGITTFVDAGSPLATIDVMKKMVDEKKLGVRLWVMIREPNEVIGPKLAQYRMIDYADGRLTVRAIKKQIDGALGSRGAWMLEPYTDKPDSSGLNTTSVSDIEATADLAIKNDFQLCVHAIGDRANRETLDLFERVFIANPAKKNLRWRIEHAQHLSLQDIPRFGALGIIASMQGIHCTSDAPFVVARLGERRAREGAYVWQKLMKTGATVANGTDTPVEDLDPIPNFYATVTRRLPNGLTFYPAQRMDRDSGAAILHTQRCLRGVRGDQPGHVEARQVRGHHRSVERHHPDSGVGDSRHESGLHDHCREGRLQEVRRLFAFSSRSLSCTADVSLPLRAFSSTRRARSRWPSRVEGPVP